MQSVRMSEKESLNHRHLFGKISKYSYQEFTGRLNIKINHTASWRIYFNGGSIIWASGGSHPVRRWLRQLEMSGCQMAVPQGMTTQNLLSSPHECWDYFALAMFMQNNHVTPEQVKSIVNGTTTEVLFDIVQGFAQVSSRNSHDIRMLKKPEATPCSQEWILPAWNLNVEDLRKQILELWQSWVTAGFVHYSPNLGVVANQEELEAKNLHSLGKYLCTIEKEDKTLRDLAIENEKSVLSIMRTLKRYFNQGLISFKSVPDLWQSYRKSQPTTTNVSDKQSTRLINQQDQGENSGEISEFQSSSSRTLSTPTSGQPQYVATPSGNVSSEEKEGVKINVMETLVAEETTRQLKAYPPRITKDIQKIDVITYALNRLSPLYASSEEGIAYQTQIAKDNYQRAIQMAVQQAIAAVRRNPLRNTTPIQSKNQNSD